MLGEGRDALETAGTRTGAPRQGLRVPTGSGQAQQNTGGPEDA